MNDNRGSRGSAPGSGCLAEPGLMEIRALLAGMDETAAQDPVQPLRDQLRGLSAPEIVAILEALAPGERLQVWQQVQDRATAIGDLLPDLLLDQLRGGDPGGGQPVIRAFVARDGRLEEVEVAEPVDLDRLQPVWIDLIAPTEETRAWIQRALGFALPKPADLTHLEASARFYRDEAGRTHLHSDFLVDGGEGSGNLPVALILHQDLLISVRCRELPVFRLQRARAGTRAESLTSGMDVLVDLYAADVEYGAHALESVYGELDRTGKQVLASQCNDQQAAEILAIITRAEHINGQTRRCMLDTRRALTFLLRGKRLTEAQDRDLREILRDIESLDGHTAFLFSKIDFLMNAIDSTININQSRIIKKLTVLNLIFMPINLIAGMGGMSEFSMMTQAVPWPLAYAGFALTMLLIGTLTYQGVKFFERRAGNDRQGRRLGRRSG